MHDSRAVANRILDLCKPLEAELTSLQLLKLVYIAHGWTLSLLGRPLLRDRVEASRFGPMIAALYDAMKPFGSGVVGKPLARFDEEQRGERLATELFDSQEEHLLGLVVGAFAPLSPKQLSNFTDAPQTPWSFVHREEGEGAMIPDDLIRAQFDTLGRRSDDLAELKQPDRIEQAARALRPGAHQAQAVPDRVKMVEALDRIKSENIQHARQAIASLRTAAAVEAMDHSPGKSSQRRDEALEDQLETDFERLKMRLELEKLELENRDKSKLIGLRNTWSGNTYLFVCIWSMAMFALLFVVAADKDTQMESTVLVSLIGTAAINVIGLILVILKGLFPASDAKPG